MKLNAAWIPGRKRQRAPSRRRPLPFRKGVLRLLGTGAVLTLLIAGGGVSLHLPARPGAATEYFRVDAGQSFTAVEASLARGGIVSFRGPLSIWARVTGKDRQIHPGTYELSAAQTPLEILHTLVSGDMILKRLTIPEGFTQAQILERLQAELPLSANDLAAAAADGQWMQSLGIPEPSLEGYLFPETYLFDPSSSAREVLGTMVRTCLAHLEGARRSRAVELGMSDHALLTLASIIELEAAVDDERARISAVYHNRLRQNLLLQADPTVAYAAGRIGERLTSQDLAVDSPFNTYQHAGLPPGPICSPGLESVDAALWPLVGCADLYFVARGDGTHIFSRSLEQHNRARAQIEASKRPPPSSKAKATKPRSRGARRRRR